MTESEHQASISYVGDLTYTLPEGVLLVERDEDYVNACRELSAAGRSSSGLKVWVRSKNHYAWLRDFIEQIGCPAIFDEKTPRLVLAEKWNVQVPDWLTDADVLDQGLLGILMLNLRKNRRASAIVYWCTSWAQPFNRMFLTRMTSSM